MTDPNQHINRERAPTKFELLLDFVKHRFWSIVGLGLLVAGCAVVLGLDLEVPRYAKVFLLTMLFLSPFGYIVGKYVVGLLWNPNYIYLLDIDARYIDGALFRFPYEDFRALDVTDGELDQLTNRLYIAKAVDLEAGTVEGTWRGTLDDRELLRSLNKIEECRGRLEEDAKRGFSIETQAFTIIRNATRAATLSIVETFERGTLPDEGDAIGEEIEAALEQFDLDKQIRHIDDDDETPTPEEAATDGLDPDDLLDEGTSEPEPEVNPADA
jgi:hypothetical protein